MSRQAGRLFEALSGVDEELLERCNREEKRKNRIVYRLFGKYGKAMAACVCLIVAGAAAWSGYRFVTGPCGSTGAADLNNAPAELSDMAQSVWTADSGGGEAGPEDGTDGSHMDAAGGTAGGGNGSGTEMDEIQADASSMAAAAEDATSEKEPIQNMQSQQSADKQETMLSPENSSGSHTDGGTGEGDNIAEEMAEMLEKEKEITDSRMIVSWEEAIALEPFAGYIPTSLPAGYEPLSARRSAFPDSWNNMIFKWSDGEQILWLNMTVGEEMTREDIERQDGLNGFLAGEFRRELIPEPVDGRISFTLYYEDGMRIDFEGYLTADEMWAVVESVLK